MSTRLIRCLGSSLHLVALFRLLLLILTATASQEAQDTMSVGPLTRYQVRVIYVAPAASNDFTKLLKAPLERWSAIQIATRPEDADAILVCRAETRILPAKVPVRWMTADAMLVDRRSRTVIWKTMKSTQLDMANLANELGEQLKKDWRKSALGF